MQAVKEQEKQNAWEDIGKKDAASDGSDGDEEEDAEADHADGEEEDLEDDTADGEEEEAEDDRMREIRARIQARRDKIIMEGRVAEEEAARDAAEDEEEDEELSASELPCVPDANAF